MEVWTIEQYRAYIRKTTKSDRKRSAAGGKTISQAEINYEALHLLPLFHSGKIKAYQPQVEFELWPRSKTEKRVVFTVDFVITKNDGSKVAVELKGKTVRHYQRDYHLRVRRFKELYPNYEFREVKSEEWSCSK